MSMKYNRQLPSPEELKGEYPLSPGLAGLKARRDEEIRAVFEGNSQKFLVVVGPCSADREDAVLEYAVRLAKLQEQVEDKLLLIPRVYTNKPRTTGAGYKGMLHQPSPDKAPDLLGGIIAIRRLHIRVMEESGLTAADEMLYPENRSYLDDVLSYEAVGARSVENQQHRLTASGMDIPVGMKNPTSGDLSVMLNSIQAAQSGHTFLYRGWDVTTTGNPLAHAILRGGVDKYGTCVPNYHYEDLMRLWELYQKRGLRFPAVVVDANHSNSDKNYKEQPRIVSEVLHSRRHSQDLRALVKGVMIESYLEEGCQPIEGERVYGKSITDPCLGWEDTQRLLLDMAGQGVRQGDERGGAPVKERVVQQAGAGLYPRHHPGKGADPGDPHPGRRGIHPVPGEKAAGRGGGISGGKEPGRAGGYSGGVGGAGPPAGLDRRGDPPGQGGEGPAQRAFRERVFLEKVLEEG